MHHEERKILEKEFHIVFEREREREINWWGMLLLWFLLKSRIKKSRKRRVSNSCFLLASLKHISHCILAILPWLLSLGGSRGSRRAAYRCSGSQKCLRNLAWLSQALVANMRNTITLHNYLCCIPDLCSQIFYRYAYWPQCSKPYVQLWASHTQFLIFF